MKNKTDKVALITGANKGIGLETARQLLSHGFHVVLTSRDKSRGQKALQDLKKENGSLTYIQLDVSDQQSIQKACDAFNKDFNHLDVLINNAAIYIDNVDSILDSKPDVISSTLKVNTLGPILVTQIFAPLLKKSSQGRVINVTSGYGSLKHMGMHVPGYSISKTALNAVTKQQAAAFQGSNVIVNAVSPGWVRTDMGGYDASLSVQQGADSLVWLATEAPSSINGQLIQERKELPW